MEYEIVNTTPVKYAVKDMETGLFYLSHGGFGEFSNEYALPLLTSDQLRFRRMLKKWERRKRKMEKTNIPPLFRDSPEARLPYLKVVKVVIAEVK